jgi:folate-dependent phosphoribosylglycinamide formyltransferase PurN
MNILLLSSAYNTLTQHAHVELKARQHRVGVAVVGSADDMAEAVEAFQPDLILCPMLTQIIPSSIWDSHRCIILHPGIIGDRGSASLDWAILNEEPTWGTTAVEAAVHVDSGPIWATNEFTMREGSKSSLYRDEVTRAAMKAMLDAVERYTSGLFVPAPLDYSAPDVRGRYRRPPSERSAVSIGRRTRRTRFSGGSTRRTARPACSTTSTGRTCIVRKRPMKPLLIVDSEADLADAERVRRTRGRLAYATTGWSSTIADVG